MTEEKTIRGLGHPRTIAGREEYQVEYEAKKFKVTPAKVREAIRQVGSDRRKVEDWLKTNP